MQNLIFLLFFIRLVLLTNAYYLDEYTKAEMNLTNTLLKGYNRNLRPNKFTEAAIIVFLKQIVQVDEKNQIFVSSSNILVEVLPHFG
jgi:hypothetical protein